MTAAAGAATLATRLVGTPEGVREATLALALVVGGGLVEGIALGLAQATVLGELLPRLRRTRWLLVTVAVAGLGWAVGSLPSVHSGGAGGTEPPLGPVLLGAAGIGLVMGAALGAAQSLLLRGLVPVPSRWVLANAVAWPPAMAVIFLGATAPDAGWHPALVLLTGAVTGAGAGTALGLVSGLLLPWVGVRSAARGLPASHGAAGGSSPSR